MIARRRDIVVPSLLADVRVEDEERSSTKSRRRDLSTRCPAAVGRRRTRCCSCAASTPVTARPRCCSASTCTSSAARWWRCSVPTARASRRCCRVISGLLEPTAGSPHLRRRRHRRAHAAGDPGGGRRVHARRQGRVPDADGRGELQARGAGSSEGPGVRRRDVRAVLRVLPGAPGTLGPEGGQPLGRRAADAHAQPGADRQAEAADDRRVEPRLGAAHRRATARHRARDPRQRHHRSCWSSSRSTSRSRWRDRAIFMEKGEVRFDGPTAGPARAPRHPARRVPAGRRRRSRLGRRRRGEGRRPRRARRSCRCASPAATSTSRRCRLPRSACPSAASAPSTA